MPKDQAYFTTWCPAGTSIETLVAVEGRRWAIEDSFETAKNELGLDHNESRSWHGWHRHVSLVMLAFAMLATIRHYANQPDASQTPIRLIQSQNNRLSAGRSRKSAALPHVLPSGASNQPTSSPGRFGDAPTKPLQSAPIETENATVVLMRDSENPWHSAGLKESLMTERSDEPV